MGDSRDSDSDDQDANDPLQQLLRERSYDAIALRTRWGEGYRTYAAWDTERGCWGLRARRAFWKGDLVTRYPLDFIIASSHGELWFSDVRPWTAHHRGMDARVKPEGEYSLSIAEGVPLVLPWILLRDRRITKKPRQFKRVMTGDVHPSSFHSWASRDEMGFLINDRVKPDSLDTADEIVNYYWKSANTSNVWIMPEVRVANDDGHYYLQVIATRDIAANEDLFFAYGVGYWGAKDEKLLTLYTDLLKGLPSISYVKE